MESTRKFMDSTNLRDTFKALNKNVVDEIARLQEQLKAKSEQLDRSLQELELAQKATGNLEEEEQKLLDQKNTRMQQIEQWNTLLGRLVALKEKWERPVVPPPPKEKLYLPPAFCNLPLPKNFRDLPLPGGCHWQGNIVLHDKTKQEMAYIPMGEFRMGTKEWSDTQPVRTIYLDPYCIGRYPVTNAQFAAFIEEGGYKNQAYWDEDGWKCQSNEKWECPRNDLWTQAPWNVLITQ